MFANDIILIIKANRKSITSVKYIFAKYELFTGQRVNFSKSKIFFPKHLSSSARLNICSSLGMTFPFKYLGVMLSPRRPPPKTHEHLLALIGSKLSCRKTNLLS
ncbi:hypothetical protein Cni_G16188 [Canna indica]|uniref:Reverse transcriptase domain-containing protein n=1 Tax=Canna indica TaxID=4628 RepID=A0AAQ3KFV1_9LILI|nr:hypothetical protein Cni_G16188 [Canna indica]